VTNEITLSVLPMVQPSVQLQPDGPPVIHVQDSLQAAPMIGPARPPDRVLPSVPARDTEIRGVLVPGSAIFPPDGSGADTLPSVPCRCVTRAPSLRLRLSCLQVLLTGRTLFLLRQTHLADLHLAQRPSSAAVPCCLLSASRQNLRWQ
jgi:hypothetical protein